MLKKKFSIITLLAILILALTLPIVRAENDTNSNDAENQTVTAINETNSSGDSENTQEQTATDSEANFKKSDIYLSGDDITVDYIVDGNLFIFANSVTINSQIGGDAFIFANSVTIGEQGYIFSNLFTISENVDIKGVVYDLYSVSENVNISGYVYRDIKVSTNSLNILGTVGRNAFVQCSNINFSSSESNSNENQQTTITSNGRISGDLNYTSKNELNIPEGTVNGKVNFTQTTTSSNTIEKYLLSLGTFIATVVLIWLIGLWISPEFVKSSDKLLIAKPLPVIGFGLLTPFALMFAFVLLLLLNITSSIAFLLLALLFILIGISTSVFVMTINNLICNKLKIQKTIGIFGMLIVSSIILWLIALIPYIGSLISFMAVIIGIGIIVSNIVLKNKEAKPKKEKVQDKTESEK